MCVNMCAFLRAFVSMCANVSETLRVRVYASVCESCVFLCVCMCLHVCVCVIMGETRQQNI
jgi:hypothetical protein